MKKIRIAIVDDDPGSITLLSLYIGMDERLELVFTETDPARALRYLRSRPIDLLLLDEDMPGIKGTSFAKSLMPMPAIVFVTAHAEVAPDAFDIGVVDFILKPVELDRFMKAIDRAVGHLLHQSLEPEEKKPTTLLLRNPQDGTVHRFHFEDISYIESQGNMMVLHLPNSVSFTFRMSLKELMEQLPEPEFMQIHKSFIIAWTKVEKFAPQSQHVYMFHIKKPLKISDTYIGAVRERLRNER